MKKMTEISDGHWLSYDGDWAIIDGTIYYDDERIDLTSADTEHVFVPESVLEKAEELGIPTNPHDVGSLKFGRRD